MDIIIKTGSVGETPVMPEDKATETANDLIRLFDDPFQAAFFGNILTNRNVLKELRSMIAQGHLDGYTTKNHIVLSQEQQYKTCVEAGLLPDSGSPSDSLQEYLSSLQNPTALNQFLYTIEQLVRRYDLYSIDPLMKAELHNHLCWMKSHIITPLNQRAETDLKKLTSDENTDKEKQNAINRVLGVYIYLTITKQGLETLFPKEKVGDYSYEITDEMRKETIKTLKEVSGNTGIPIIGLDTTYSIPALISELENETTIGDIFLREIQQTKEQLKSMSDVHF